MLRDTALSPALDLDVLAAHTDGFSGSDLQELCRNAAMVPLKEYMRSEEGLKIGVPEGFKLRELTFKDFMNEDSDPLPPAGTQAPVSAVSVPPLSDTFEDPE